MAVREIRIDGDEILKKKSKPVTAINDRILILLDDMAETMYENDGAGIAAPQVGVLKRICIVDDGEGKKELINPKIIESSGVQDGPEGCLSLPETSGMVKRPDYVLCRAMDRNGKMYEIEAQGLLARAICHEIDHLNGILYVDRAYEMIPLDSRKK